MENTRKNHFWTAVFIPLVLFFISVSFSLWTYASLPDYLETYSKVEWITQKQVAVAVIPFMMLIIFALFRLGSLVGQRYVNTERLQGMLNVLLIFILSSLLFVHAFTLIGAANLYIYWNSPDFIIRIVTIIMAVYLIIIGNYLPRIQRSTKQANSSMPQQEKPLNVLLHVVKMKLLGLNFLSELYLLGLGSPSPDSRLEKQVGALAARTLMLGGLLVGLSAFLPGNFPLISAMVILLVIGVILVVGVTRLKKKM